MPRASIAHVRSRLLASTVLLAIGGMICSPLCLLDAAADEPVLTEPHQDVPPSGSIEPPSSEPPSLSDDVGPPARSLSCGSANRGALGNAAELPQQGPGFTTPEPWWSRGHRYGTNELIALLMRATAATATAFPGSMLGIADLSKESGGALPGHRSHQSGRDADLIFYTLDASGQPLTPDQYMGYFTNSGRAYYAKAPSWNRHIPERYFDLARNWALIKTLITDRDTVVQNIFVSRRIRRWLLDYARAIGEPDDLMMLAGTVLHAVDHSHNDHMHIRIACSANDIAEGRCNDELAPRRRGRRKYHRRVDCPVASSSTLQQSRPTASKPVVAGQSEAWR